MQTFAYGQARVAPGRTRKSQEDLEDLKDVAGNTLAGGSARSSPADMTEESYSPRPKFHNFLRATYVFQPQTQFSATTVTLPLAAGDIILVHSIHTNGWADGTLLGSGERGWLPTNYCQSCDYATMRPLLKALTEFWDLIRSSGQAILPFYRNHDYMRGMVAGVRFLLEKSKCLTRNATLVKEHDSIRRIRKSLLTDLSLLVKASKHAQQLGHDCDSTEFDSILEELLMKAFHVVIRAVDFFDAWAVISGFVATLNNLSVSTFSDASSTRSHVDTARTSVVQPDSPRPNQIRSQSPGSISGSTVHHFSRPRPASISRPPVLTHRMSYVAGSIRSNRGNFASESLSDTYDAFLGVLASFLGSHMQSRSSEELLLTTQQAVKSCRKLLEIVEIIFGHDLAPADDLQLAKDAMYDNITELVHATREVFPPVQSEETDSMVYLHEEGAELVNAATACVKSAGFCVAQSRILLEDVGDFEIELRDDRNDSPSGFESQLFMSPPKAPSSLSHRSGTDTVTSGHSANSALEIAHDFLTLSSTTGDLNMTPATTSTVWTATTETSPEPPSPTSLCSHEVSHADGRDLEVAEERALARTILHGSESTLVSSARDSGPSFVSQTSTRATSPESHFKGSFCRSYDEEREDPEYALMELQFAHELVVNPEGRVIGGSLNAVIERLTAHDSTPEPSFVAMVYLTFRLFASPMEFAEALAYRFDYIGQTPHIAQPVRLRVSNVLKGWLESHWRHDCDELTIPFISDFIREKVVRASSIAGQRLLELLNTVVTTHAPAVPRILSAMGKTNTVSSAYISSDQPFPQPMLSKSQLDLLKSWKMSGSVLSVVDFDPMEVARQLTVKTSEIFCSILPEELLGGEFTKKSGSLAVNVRAMSTLSNDLANLVVDSVLQLDMAKKRAAVVKQWIKIASKCLILHNYDTLMTIVASITSTSIQRLRKTWDLVGPKTRTTLDDLKSIIDHTKNYSGLRQRFQNMCNPCLPYIGIYLTDLTFIDQGNSASRDLKTGDTVISVINVDKHMKTAKIISDLQRFQIKYKLTSIDELQTWLQNEFVRVRVAGERDFQNQWRRSLILEPRDVENLSKATKMNTFTSMTSFSSRDKFDLLSWTHTIKERNSSISS